MSGEGGAGTNEPSVDGVSETAVETKRPTYRPARASAAGSVGIGLFVVWFAGASTVVRDALLVETVGLAVLAAGYVFVVHDERVAGTGVALVGITFVGLSFVLLADSAPRTSIIVTALPGMVGTFVLALGVLPVRGSGSRALVRLGAGLVFGTVLAAGLFRAPVSTLLVGGVAAILAWDLGEQSINVGEQLGRRATTWPIEVSHAAASAMIAAGAVVTGHLLAGVGTGGLPLSGLLVLLLAAIALTLSLHG